jgi:hypothetical protein
MAAQSEQVTKPPYVAYRTFVNSLNKLQERGIPGRIDSSVFAGQSGSGIAALLAAYKYLGLMEESGAPSAALKELVELGESERGPLMRALIEGRYEFLRPPTIVLADATTQQIEAAFREQGIKGSTITKAVSFFLNAAQDAGIEVSKHIKTPQPKRNGGGGTKTRRAKPSVGTPSPPPGDPHPQRHGKVSPVELLLAKFPDFDPTWPEDIKKNWFESFGALRGAMLKGEDQ